MLECEWCGANEHENGLMHYAACPTHFEAARSDAEYRAMETIYKTLEPLTHGARVEILRAMLEKIDPAS